MVDEKFKNEALLCAQFSQYAYGKEPTPPNGYTVIPLPNTYPSGMQAVACQKDNTLIIAYRGSERAGDQLSKDWFKTDIPAIANIVFELKNLMPEQFTDALDFYDSAAATAPDCQNVYITGHSLGGALAQWTAANKPERNPVTYTYNCFGIKHFLFLLPNYICTSIIHNCYIEDDVVHKFTDHQGNLLNRDDSDNLDELTMIAVIKMLMSAGLTSQAALIVIMLYIIKTFGAHNIENFLKIPPYNYTAKRHIITLEEIFSYPLYILKHLRKLLPIPLMQETAAISYIQEIKTIPSDYKEQINALIDSPETLEKIYNEILANQDILSENLNSANLSGIKALSAEDAINFINTLNDADNLKKITDNLNKEAQDIISRSI